MLRGDGGDVRFAQGLPGIVVAGLGQPVNLTVPHYRLEKLIGAQPQCPISDRRSPVGPIGSTV